MYVWMCLAGQCTCKCMCVQNLIEVGSELLHFRNLPLWGEINTVSNTRPHTPHTPHPLIRTDVSIGSCDWSVYFHWKPWRGSLSEQWRYWPCHIQWQHWWVYSICTINYNILTLLHAALVVITPNCETEGNITISSSLLESPVEGGDSSIQLPPTVFGEEFECTEVGVIAVIYNGVGPLLNIDNELLPGCTPTLPPLVHGQW